MQPETAIFMILNNRAHSLQFRLKVESSNDRNGAVRTRSIVLGPNLCQYIGREALLLSLVEVPCSKLKHLDLERIADKLLIDLRDGVATRHRLVHDQVVVAQLDDVLNTWHELREANACIEVILG